MVARDLMVSTLHSAAAARSGRAMGGGGTELYCKGLGTDGHGRTRFVNALTRMSTRDYSTIPTVGT